MKKKKKKPVNKDTKTYKKKELKKLANKCLKLWRAICLKRDGGCCVLCGDKELVAVHHIESSKTNKGLRFEPANGVSLCARKHHRFTRSGFHNSFCTAYEYLTKNREIDLAYLLEHYKDEIEITQDYLLNKIEELEGE
jgi:5-methylcytosine-specific restriction endonuclease McrA